MSIPRQITDYLESHHVPYHHGTHEPRYTAQEIAHVQHISGRNMAKVVMIMADGRPVMTVLPASHRVDLSLLRQVLGAEHVRLMTEVEFTGMFPGCEPGAMPPLGDLFHVEMLADVSLRDLPDVVFNAGTHTDTIEMRFADLEALVHPRITRFAWLSQ